MPPKKRKLIRVDDDEDDADDDYMAMEDEILEEPDDDDDDAYEEEHFDGEDDFLETIEQDNAKRSFSDSTKLTSRQRAMIADDDPFQENLVQLPLTNTKKLSSEELEEKAARREAANRRRQLLVKQRAEDEKRAVVEKLLKQQKHSKAATEPIKRERRVVQEPSIRTIYGKTITVSYRDAATAPKPQKAK